MKMMTIKKVSSTSYLSNAMATVNPIEQQIFILFRGQSTFRKIRAYDSLSPENGQENTEI